MDQDLKDVAWLWTHCRALGMTRSSDSGSMRDDVALYVYDLHAALNELVKLKDMKTEFDERKQHVEDFASAAVLEGIAAEYQRRKPLAWETARLLVRQT